MRQAGDLVRFANAQQTENTSMSLDTTNRLSEFNLRTSWEDIPQEILHEGKRCLINFIAVAMYSSRDPSLDILLNIFDLEGGKSHSSIFGVGRRTTMQNAALANGYLGHLEDYDDTHYPTVIHPSSPTFPAALAVGEQLGVSGRDVLVASVLGMEICCRIGVAVVEEQYNHCWHITGTCGVFGAAMAAGRLVGLDTNQMVYAAGIAATQASGLREGFGTMTKPFHPGRAAQSGVMAALLADGGFTATTQAIEGERGFARAFSEHPQLFKATEELGDRWEILSNGLKLYSCGMATHSLIDAAVSLRSEEGVTPENIESIRARVHPSVLEKVNRSHPATGMEGKFSLQHCIALGLVEGAALPHHFIDAKVADRTIAALRDRIIASPEPMLDEEEAELDVVLQDGRTLTRRVNTPTGSPANPVTDSQLEGKFMSLVRDVLPRPLTEQLLNQLWELDRVEDIRAMLRLTRVRGRRVRF